VTDQRKDAQNIASTKSLRFGKIEEPACRPPATSMQKHPPATYKHGERPLYREVPLLAPRRRDLTSCHTAGERHLMSVRGEQDFIPVCIKASLYSAFRNT
jgi:hypothetical protein